MLTTINFKPGDTIKVHQRIQEGEKTRIQIFRGIVLGIKGRGENAMFTVLKMVGDISVERIWAVSSPQIEKVEVAEARKKTTRAKLKHLKVAKK